MAVPTRLSSVSDVDLEGFIAGIKTRQKGKGTLSSDPSFANWAGTFGCHPEAIFYPSTEDDVRCLVELARRKGKKLRPFGAGHSPSDLVCVQEDDWLVQMDKLNKLLEVGRPTLVLCMFGMALLSNEVDRENTLARSIPRRTSSRCKEGSVLETSIHCSDSTVWLSHRWAQYQTRRLQVPSPQPRMAHHCNSETYRRQSEH